MGRAPLALAGMPSPIRSVIYGKNGFDDARISESRLAIRTLRSPRGARVPRFSPKFSDGSGSAPYSASLTGNGDATCDSE